MSNHNSTLLLATLIINNVAVAALNDTGIKTCSNTTENGLPCPVAEFPGQDAEFGTNKFDFTKLDANGNALPATATSHVCVKDNVTGLIWEVKSDDNNNLRYQGWTYTWYNSNATDGNFGMSSGTRNCATKGWLFGIFGRCDTEKFVADVNAQGLCGHNDWRLPNPQELASIVDYSIAKAGSTIDTDMFPDDADSFFFTTSTYTSTYPSHFSVDGAEASGCPWIVDFGDGDVRPHYRNYPGAIRLVRGSQWLLSLAPNADGTITDQTNGLMWAKCAEDLSGNDCTSGSVSRLTWADALTTANNATLAGYNDWRLPNVKELQSLVDYTKYNPSINIRYFPNTPLEFFWTASTYAADVSHPWVINFSDGHVVSNYNRDSTGAVRLVRTVTK